MWSKSISNPGGYWEWPLPPLMPLSTGEQHGGRERELRILCLHPHYELYRLESGWQPQYMGQLKLRHRKTGRSAEVAPLFNRCVIMHMRDCTLVAIGTHW